MAKRTGVRWGSGGRATGGSGHGLRLPQPYGGKGGAILPPKRIKRARGSR